VDTEDVRLAVYRSFAVAGRAPERDSLDEHALRELHDQRHLVLGADDEIVMAHPFSAVPLGFSVMGRETLWWGGCAWDSFALAHLLSEEPDVLVATRCPGCDAALAWVVGRGAPPTGDEVAHFLTPVAHMWDDVVHTCGNQRLFCREECVAAWLARTGHERGYVMDLPTLWRLARGWYEGRLTRGYQRREPSEARDYFRSAGLSGPFWGL
jgi:Alkylmercury lyase